MARNRLYGRQPIYDDQRSEPQDSGGGENGLVNNIPIVNNESSDFLCKREV